MMKTFKSYLSCIAQAASFILRPFKSMVFCIHLLRCRPFLYSLDMYLTFKPKLYCIVNFDEFLGGVRSSIYDIVLFRQKYVYVFFLGFIWHHLVFIEILSGNTVYVDRLIEYGWGASRRIETASFCKTFLYYSRTYSCRHRTWD